MRALEVWSNADQGTYTSAKSPSVNHTNASFITSSQYNGFLFHPLKLLLIEVNFHPREIRRITGMQQCEYMPKEICQG